MSGEISRRDQLRVAADEIGDGGGWAPVPSMRLGLAEGYIVRIPDEGTGPMRVDVLDYPADELITVDPATSEVIGTWSIDRLGENELLEIYVPESYGAEKPEADR